MARPLRGGVPGAQSRSATWDVPAQSWPAVCVNLERCVTKSKRSRPRFPTQKANRMTASKSPGAPALTISKSSRYAATRVALIEWT